MWDAVKAVLRGKFIAVHTYVRKEERYEIKNLRFHLRKLKKERKLYIKYVEIRDTGS